jgi:YVTN family beta-propeller protein
MKESGVAISAISKTGVGTSLALSPTLDDGPGSHPSMREYSPQTGSQTISTPIAAIRVGISPDWATYDSRNGYVYVTDFGNDTPPSALQNVSIINGTSLLATVVVGAKPWSAVCDTQNGYVYVVNEGSSNVSVINGTRVIKSISVGYTPEFASYDAVNGLIYVTNLGGTGPLASYVSVINSTSVIATVGGLQVPAQADYDHRTGLLYVPDSGDSNLTVINGTKAIATIGVVADPGNSVYDDRNGYMYVASGASTSPYLTIVNGTKVVGSVAVGTGSSTWYALYDPKDGFVYDLNAPGALSGNASVIDGTMVIATLGVGSVPHWGVYDSENGYIYVSNRFNSGSNSAPSNVTVINGTREVDAVSVGDQPGVGAYDDRNHYIYVPNEGSNNVSVIEQTYPVTFVERGLGGGTSWSVILNGTAASSTSSNVTFTEYDGNYSYSVGNVSGYAVNPTSGTVSVNASSRIVSIAFSKLGILEGTITPPSNNGSSAVVLVNGKSVPVDRSGGFLETVPAIPSPYNVTAELIGYRSSTDTVVVTPGNVSWTNFTLTPALTAPPYAVILTETGLPSGTSWSVTLDGNRNATRSTSIEFNVSNGSYSYSLGAVPGWRTSIYTGSIQVNGTEVVRSFYWWQTTYLGVMNESGLPAFTWWWINISGGNPISTANRSTSFTEPNGTYTYTASAVNKNFSAPGGTFSINGSRIFEAVHFSQRNYSVTFTESGLPSGINWSVLLMGPNRTTVTERSRIGTADVAAFDIVNGSYTFEIVPVAGYNAAPSAGTLLVDGQSVSEAISFSPSSSVSTFLGLPATQGYALLGGIAAAVAVVALVLVLRNRRRGFPPNPAEPPL